MLLTLILHMALLLIALLYIVPAATDGGVAIRRNSGLRGVLALVVVALANKIFWHVLTLSGIGLSIPLELFTLGVVAWLVNAICIFATGRIMPGILYVRSFGAAMGASLILILAGWAISPFLL
ncbi:MAG: phage holin family protein [Cyanobacteria bacterium REEB67]|nr:phage holin family protein [Cyanobacteria bacterium REEB67]